MALSALFCTCFCALAFGVAHADVASQKRARFGLKGLEYNVDGYDKHGYDVLGFDTEGYDTLGRPVTDEYAGTGTGHLVDSMQRFQVDERLQGVGKEMTNGKGITPDNYEASLHKNEKNHEPGGDEPHMTVIPNEPYHFPDKTGTWDQPLKLFGYPHELAGGVWPEATLVGMTNISEPWINVVVQPTPCVTWDKKHGWVTTWPTPAIIYECGRAAFCRDGQTVCVEGRPLCAPGQCMDGYFNSFSLPFSECIDMNLQVLGNQGIAMSSDGHWLVQGTPQWVNSTGPDENPRNFTGQAVVYYRQDLNTSDWKQLYVLVPKQNHVGDWFGNSVAICGDGSRIVVGAWLSNARGVRSGAAYVFERNGDPVWGQCYGEEVKLVPSDGQPFDYFGSTVAISDDCTTVTVGAFGSDSCGVFSGAAYVYLADTKGVVLNPPLTGKLPKLVKSKVVRWTEVQKLTAPVCTEMSMFGQAIAINNDGSSIFISGRNLPSVYVYRFSLRWLEWTFATEIFSPTVGNIGFGHALDVTPSGDYLAVGAPWASFGGRLNSGAVFVFRLNRGNGLFVLCQNLLTAPDASSGDLLGYSVSINANGALVLAGAPGKDYNSVEDMGAAYYFGTLYHQIIPDLVPIATLTTIGQDITTSTTITSTIYPTTGAPPVPTSVQIMERSNFCGGIYRFMNLRLNATAPANTLFGLSVSIDGRGNSAAVSDAMNKVDTYFWAPGEFP